MKRTIILSIVVLLAMVSLTQAETRLVPSQYPTIQTAVDDCNEGDTVVVADGIYTGDGNENSGGIDLLGKAITIRSENGPESCIINGSEGRWTGFVLRDIDNADVILEGFTIRDFGLGIFCERSLVIIRNCILTGNEDGIELSGHRGDGGGRDGTGSEEEVVAKVEVYNCTITNNHSFGISGDCSTLKLINCNVSNNGIGGIGGTAFFDNSELGLPEINNCIINDNGRSGISVYRSRTNVVLNIIDSEISRNGGNGVSTTEFWAIQINNCTIVNNVTEGVNVAGTRKVEISNSEISGNGGQGISIGNSRRVTTDLVQLNNCTIINNATEGVNVAETGKVEISNSEISGNGGQGIRIGNSGRVTTGLVQVNNCIVTNNNGCGISNEHGSTTISDCNISNNAGPGVICNGQGRVIDCDISYNKEGGIQGRGSVAVNGCKIRGNTNDFGGAIRASRLTVTNSVITQNSAERGGAIYIHSEGGYGNLIIRNCTIIGNSTTYKEGAIAISNYSNATNLIANSVIRDNYPEQISSIYSDAMPLLSVIYSNIQGGWDGEGFGNVDVDPMFELAGYWADVNDADVIVEPNDPNAAWVDGDYHLLLDSPCIDTGDPNYVAEANETDLDGYSRIVNGVVDMGAYEFELLTPVELLLDLADQIDELGLNKGIANSLRSKLEAALGKLEDDNEKNNVAAINSLQAFINTVEAQSGKKIPEADGDALIEAAQEIIELLGQE